MYFCPPKLLKFLLVAFSTLCLSQACIPNKQEEAKTTEAKTAWKKEWNQLNTQLQQLPTDLAKTTFLRAYCAELADIGRPSKAALSFHKTQHFDDIDLPLLYTLFKNDSLPALCGLTSNFYIKLAQSFGYKAYQYSFGFTAKPFDRYIHSFPLIAIDVDGTEKLIVQDPFLNLIVTNDKGEPMDFLDFLSTLKQKNYTGIKMDTSAVWTSLIVPDTSLYWPTLNDSCRTLMRQYLLESPSPFPKKIPILRSYDRLMRSSCDHFEQGFVNALQANGYGDTFLYAYTLRVNTMVGSPNVRQLESKIDSLLSQTISDDLF